MHVGRMEAPALQPTNWLRDANNRTTDPVAQRLAVTPLAVTQPCMCTATPAYSDSDTVTSDIVTRHRIPPRQLDFSYCSLDAVRVVTDYDAVPALGHPALLNSNHPPGRHMHAREAVLHTAP